MNIYLCPNLYNEKQRAEAIQGIEILERLGHNCFLSADSCERLTGLLQKDRDTLSPAECDLIVSLGGDGAVLRAAQVAIRADKPLFGINSGRLGYLCAMNMEEIEKIDQYLNTCHISERALLETVVEGKAFLAVNDIVIAKQQVGTTVDLTISIEDYAQMNVRGDGVVISTPTGSTAYGMSAGGPILDPSCKAAVITTLHASRGMNRSVVINQEHRIRISERMQEAAVVVDGTNCGPIGEELEIRVPEKKLYIYESGMRTV